jgi:predicted extracellular nuclease
MYNGDEFIEFTNVGGSAVDMAGWSYDDDSRTAFSFDLSAFDLVAAGESVILAESLEADFRTNWGLAPAVKVIGSNSVNLGRNDEINIFDAGGSLVDRLTYGDQTFVGSIRTTDVSGITTPNNYGTNDVFAWFLSSVGDNFGSHTSVGGQVGNPGAAPVPEPTTVVALSLGAAALLRRRRR